MHMHSIAIQPCKPLTTVFAGIVAERDELKRRNHSLRMKVHRLKQRHVKASMGVKKKATKASEIRKITEIGTQLSNYLSGAKLEFVMSQIRCATKKAKGRRWTVKDKALALSLLHASPKTYRLLKRVFD